MTSNLDLQIINRLEKLERDMRTVVYNSSNKTTADGWIKVNPGITRVSNHVFRINGIDWTSISQPGMKIKYYEGGGSAEYGVVSSSTYGGVNTAVNLITNTDYAMAANPDTLYYSYLENPAGWPGWFNWAPTITGYSVLPATTMYRWQAQGRTIKLAIQETVNGTSNAGATTYTLPVTAAAVTNGAWGGNARIVDNGVVQLPPGALLIVASGTTFSLFLNWGLTAMTAANGKRISIGGIIYEM